MTQEEIAILVKLKDEASKQVQELKSNFGGLGDTLGKVGTIAGGFLAANVVAGGVEKLTGFIGDSIAAVKESMQVNAQLEAVLASTGNVAGVTADHVSKLAGSLEKNSLFEDEAILKGQNLLLTFTNIRNDTEKGIETFDDATKIMVDMAAAMGTDASGAAIQLGKALNDPTNGISALTRVGVTFTDEQKDQIATMQEAGDMAGAQAVILQELTKEFGGSAQAQSDAAGASEKYKDRMNDLQEEIGAKMLPINEKLMEAKIALIDLLTTKVIPVLEELYAKHWPAIQAAIESVVNFVVENWPKIQPVIEFAANFVKTQIEGMIQVIQGIVEVVTGVVALVDAVIHGDWQAAWSALQQIAEGIIDIFLGNIKRMFGSIPGIILDAVGDLSGLLVDKGTELANGLINGIKNALRNFRISGSIGGVDLGPLGSTPSVSVNIQPFSFLARGVRNWPGGWAVVGDDGPELINLQPGANVFSSAESGGVGRSTNVQVNINGPVYGDRAGAQSVAGTIGWETALELQRRGAA